MNAKLWSTRVGLLLLLGFTAAFCWSSPLNVSAAPALQEESPLPPLNDNFAAAEGIASLRFETVVDTVAATLEAGEASPSCIVENGGIFNTVWYSFTPPARRVYEVGFDAPFYTALGVYTGSSLADLQEYACTSWNNTTGILLEGGTTYYFQLGSLAYGFGGNISFYLDIAPMMDPVVSIGYYPYLPYAGSNVDFFGDVYDPEGWGFASFAWSFGDGTTATDRDTIHVYTSLGQYTVELRATTVDGRTGVASRTIEVTAPPPPNVSFYFYGPYNPSTFDELQFNGSVWDPVGQQASETGWDFGDGSTASGMWASHRYAQEGSYIVSFWAKMPDGRTGSTSQTIVVANHDVAIVKITVPNSARAGQTRQISVGVSSKYHDEVVRLYLYKSGISSYQTWEYVGELRQLVQSATKSTPFDYTYTFTGADAQRGSVNFRARAIIESGDFYELQDLQPSNNEYISLPTKVSGGKVGAAAEADLNLSESDSLLYLPIVMDK